MRKLNTADLFCAARAIKRSGLREELKKVTLRIAHGADIENVGLDTMLTIVEVFAEKSAEQTIYEVLAGPFEMSPDEVSTLELSQLCDCLEELSKDPGIKDFFGRLSDILSKS